MSVTETRMEKLNARNYSTWSTTLASLLKSKGLWLYCTERSKIDKDEDLMKSNEEAKHTMYATMDPAQIACTGVCETAYDLWMKIKENNEGAEADRKNNALADFLGFKYRKDETVVQYCGRYESSLGRLQSTGYSVDDETQIWVFRNSLSKELKSVVNTWCLARPEGKMTELITALKVQYHMEKSENADDSIAFYGREGSSSNSKNKMNKFSRDKTQNKKQQSSNQTKSNDKSCTYCKMNNHVWKDCRKLKADNERKKKFANKKSYKNSDNATAFMAKEQEEAECPKFDRHTWIIDSGASNHMTPYKDLLENYEEFDEPRTIYMGNGKPTEAYGQGKITFTSKEYRTIFFVAIWVPKLLENLFSVGRTVTQGVDVKFVKNSTQVLFIKDNELMLKGHQINKGLFALKIIPRKQSATKTSERALIAASMDEWHKRFAHCSVKTIKELVRSKAVEGLDIKGTADSDHCEGCAINKICRTSHPSRTTNQATADSRILHIDTCGPMSTPSLGFAKYFVLATEEYSGYRLIEFTPEKRAIWSLVKRMINQIEFETKNEIKMLVSDNGTEYVNQWLEEFLSKKGIIHCKSTPYTPEQNGLAERSNRTIIEGARTLLNSNKLKAELWAEACSATVYSLNRTLSIRDKTKTKYELYFGEKPNVSNLRKIGQAAIVRHHNSLPKFSEKGRKCIFVGYTNRRNTYRFYDPRDNRIVLSCDAVLLDQAGRLVNDDPNKSESNEAVILTVHQPRAGTVSSSDTSGYDALQGSFFQNLDDNIQEPVNQSNQSTSTNQSEETETISDVSTSIVSPESPKDVRQTRSKTRKEGESFFKDLSVPRWFWNPLQSSTDDQSENAQIALFTLDDEPRTLEDAKADEAWPQWKQAMDEELEALNKNKTWTLVKRPEGVKPVKCKWVFKIKLDPKGEVDRYKARLVAKGYSQIANVDYKETFAPVASMITIRTLFAIANQEGMRVLQFDVKTAFLHGDLDETIYMEYPDGYPNPDNQVCKLTKSLYGLKQAPRQWNIKFDTFLKKFSLKQSKVDKCLYYDHDRSIILAIYVDDGLLVAKNTTLRDKLIQYLQKHFELKVMECESYLGFQVEINKKERTTKLYQAQYVDKVLEKFGMLDCKPASTPEEVGVPDFSDSTPLTEEYPFKELVGSLLYLVTCTRPDIAHALSVASRTSKPTLDHWKLLKRILRYLKGTRDMGICFRWEKWPELIAYSDADYANDTETRRSTTGYCMMFGGGPIAWRCQRQSIVSLSTTEAEYIAGCELVKELIPLRELFRELRMIDDEPTIVFIDNQSTVRITRNEGGQQRTKHIDVREKWLNEQHEKGTINVKFIKGEDQVADILTKPLHKTKFELNRKLLLTSLALMTILTLSLGTSAEYNFVKAPLVNFVPSRVQYYGGDTEFSLNITIMNPCETYFADTSPKKSDNDKLIGHCNSLFESYLVGMLIDCRDADGSRVVKDHVTVDSGDLVRTKRIVPLFYVAGVAIVAGVQAFTITKTEQNAENIKELLSQTNDLKAYIDQSIKLFNATRHTITAINTKIAEQEKKLDFLDKRMDSYPRTLALMAEATHQFGNIARHLGEIGRLYTHKVASPAVMKLINKKLWVEPASLNSKVHKCDRSFINGNLNLLYDFRVPKADPEVVILEADSFLMVNTTKLSVEESSGKQTNDTILKYCLLKYAGPDLVLYNKTANCYTEVDQTQVDKRSGRLEVVRGVACTEENKQMSEIKTGKELFETAYCKTQNPYVTPTPKESGFIHLQVREYGGFVRIYCYTHNITIGKNGQHGKHECPEYPFTLPLSETWSIKQYTHEATSLNLATINTVEIQINKEIQDQVKLDEVKLYGVNMTEYETHYGILEAIYEKISEGNFTLKEFKVPEMIKSPLKKIKEFGSLVMDKLEEGMIIMAIGAGIMVFVLAAPFLELLLLALAFIRKFGFLILKIMGKPGQALAKKMNKSHKTKPYWDRTYKHV